MGIFKNFFKRLFGINPKDDFPLDDGYDNPNEVIIQNTIDMTIFALKRVGKLSTAKSFEVAEGYMMMKITNKDDSEYLFDLDAYINHDDQDMTEKRYENEILRADKNINEEYVNQEVLKRSISLLK